MRTRAKISTTLLLALILSGLVSGVPFSSSFTGQKIAEFMTSPLPSAPVAAVKGGDFPVSVNDLSASLAGGQASGWSGVISSIYGSHTVSLKNGTFSDGKWLLYFTVPAAAKPGIYNLTLTQSKGSESLSVQQNHAVWVLDEWPESITLTQITDIHESNTIGEVVFPSFIMQTNFINPDLMIATGDIVDTEFVSRSWTYLQYAFLQLEYPGYLLPGNHDYSGYGGKGFSMYGGMLNYTLVLGDFVVIALDSAENGYFKDGQVAWLETQLVKYHDKVKVIAFHHPLLSSEYEEDMGSVTGGYIDADLDNVDNLAQTMYFTWKDTSGNPLDVTRKVFSLIKEHDVRLILNGHVHRDMIYIVNNRHYFVTTSTSGGGLPPESRFGSRLITIDNDGSVHLDQYAEAGLNNPPNNIPTGYLKYTYRSANDFTGTAVSVKLENNLDMDIDEGRLIFKVSKNKPLGDYVFVGEQPVRVETTTTEKGYVFDAFFDVEAESGFETTLKAVADTANPEIVAKLAEPYQLDMPVQVILTASDYGWGLKDLSVSYSVDGGNTWAPVESEIEPVLTGTVYMDTYPEVDVSFDVLSFPHGASLLVKAEATDYAGNTASYQSYDLTAGEPVIYTLSVSSSPIDVEFTLNDESYSTPYEGEHIGGTFTLSVPETVQDGDDEYEFKRWSTGSTNLETILELSADTSLSVTYELVEPSTPDEPEPENGGGIPIPPAFVLFGVASAAVIAGLRKREQ